MSKFFVNFVIGLHLTTAWGCASVGAYEVHSQYKNRYFSDPKDDLYTASARGLIRGVYYPYRTLSNVPKVWASENTGRPHSPPWL